MNHFTSAQLLAGKTTPAVVEQSDAAPRAATRKVKPEPRIMDLIGCDISGENRAYWSRGERVQPIDKLRRGKDGWIQSGHYVIQWCGREVVVHLGNCIDKGISLQFMRGELGAIRVSLRDINRMVVGRVISDPKVEARITARIKELSAAWQALQEPAP